MSNCLAAPALTPADQLQSLLDQTPPGRRPVVEWSDDFSCSDYLDLAEGILSHAGSRGGRWGGLNAGCARMLRVARDDLQEGDPASVLEIRDPRNWSADTRTHGRYPRIMLTAHVNKAQNLIIRWLPVPAPYHVPTDELEFSPEFLSRWGDGAYWHSRPISEVLRLRDFRFYFTPESTAEGLFSSCILYAALARYAALKAAIEAAVDVVWAAQVLVERKQGKPTRWYVDCPPRL